MDEETRFARVEVTVTSADGRVAAFAADWPAKAGVTVDTGLQAALRGSLSWPSVIRSPPPVRLLVEVEADGRRPITVAVRPATRADQLLPAVPDDEVVAFAGARLAEDERAACALGGTEWTAERLGDHDYEIRVIPDQLTHAIAPTRAIADVQREDVAEWVAAQDPRHALRDVVAKRAIIGRQESDHAPVETMYGLCCRTCVDWQDAPLAEGGETEFGIAIPQAWPCRAARSVLASWSGHPGYREAWKP